ncbi:uncharacterized protein LOC129967164 [Argiope bruennichi]|uniref:uncharacterized protein LOC129967164 n=1 Tax=Argiope bruennichi TaxID=94029 RepID=UPI002494E499|nr:uncharacterized protein LOC129967164 [Argiope bruennichi]
MPLLRNVILVLIVSVVCLFTLPKSTSGHHHKGRNNGLDTLLTAGVLAKVLQKNEGGHHSHPIFIPIPYPVHQEHHHDDHHHHHGTRHMPHYQQLRHAGVPTIGGHPPFVGYQPVPMSQQMEYVQQSPFQGTDEVKVIIV